MEEKYYKVSESALTEIAEAIRLKKGSDKKYLLDNMAKIIKAMLVLPSGLAETSATIKTGASASAIIPTVYKGVARSAVNVTVTTSAEGVLTEELTE